MISGDSSLSFPTKLIFLLESGLRKCNVGWISCQYGWDLGGYKLPSESRTESWCESRSSGDLTVHSSKKMPKVHPYGFWVHLYQGTALWLRVIHWEKIYVDDQGSLVFEYVYESVLIRESFQKPWIECHWILIIGITIWWDLLAMVLFKFAHLYPVNRGPIALI